MLTVVWGDTGTTVDVFDAMNTEGCLHSSNLQAAFIPNERHVSAPIRHVVAKLRLANQAGSPTTFHFLTSSSTRCPIAVVSD
jgi:hypothetical protein